ncbi:NAD-dependent protein lipoamidase sirtuin-4 [Modicella reniformis]|uniref:NAD-dependent protein lipoamidase sirtuin-4 n=1 Tax=Modicella reniformis TaxID=1440133 RepID=A0A9P6MLL7_9FUNG|nr:NAD-dependent protein lipoamidase sirtuin-4 [Modicella reniformis]
MRLRISLPSFSKALSTVPSKRTPFPTAVQELTSFLRDGRPNITILTGAGVSTDSAIPDYRGENGTYTLNPDYKPVFYQAFVRSDDARHRYWARSFLGFPPVMTTQPNPTHYALAALQAQQTSSTHQPGQDQDHTHKDHLGYVRTLITQNVDGLHQKAGTKDIIELHGTLHRVKCMSCGHERDRSEFQQILADLNPNWNEMIQSNTTSSLYSRMNADGDVELNTAGQQDLHSKNLRQRILDYHTFQYPTCSNCGSGHYKPSVVFFGENVPKAVKERSMQTVLEADGLLVVGTSLATYSAFRLVKLAKDAGIPIALINLGYSRGDALADLRYDESSTHLLKAVANELGLGEIPGLVKKHFQHTLNVIGS